MPRSVAIVFDPNYSASLEKLAFRTPVWIVDTPDNHAAAEDAWRAASEWPHISVTLFRPPGEQVLKEDWETLLEQIVLLERSLEAVEVIGVALHPMARAALMEAGLERFEETANGFRARKS